MLTGRSGHSRRGADITQAAPTNLMSEGSQVAVDATTTQSTAPIEVVSQHGPLALVPEWVVGSTTAQQLQVYVCLALLAGGVDGDVPSAVAQALEIPLAEAKAALNTLYEVGAIEVLRAPTGTYASVEVRLSQRPGAKTGR